MYMVEMVEMVDMVERVYVDVAIEERWVLGDMWDMVICGVFGYGWDGDVGEVHMMRCGYG